MRIRPLWEELCADGRYTVFQDFELNLLAAARFAEREEPYVVCAESERGAAIVPAALRRSDGTVRLLGEELFDYRTFLHRGDDEVLRAALAALGELGRPLEIVAMREGDRSVVIDELEIAAFCRRAGRELRDKFRRNSLRQTHTRLARNLRQNGTAGLCSCGVYDGANPQLLRSIYAAKAEQSESSLFHDSARD